MLGTDKITLQINNSKTNLRTLKDSANIKEIISGGVFIDNGIIIGGPNNLEKVYLN